MASPVTIGLPVSLWQFIGHRQSLAMQSDVQHVPGQLPDRRQKASASSLGTMSDPYRKLATRQNVAKHWVCQSLQRYLHRLHRHHRFPHDIRQTSNPVSLNFNCLSFSGFHQRSFCIAKTSFGNVSVPKHLGPAAIFRSTLFSHECTRIFRQKYDSHFQ